MGNTTTEQRQRTNPRLSILQRAVNFCQQFNLCLRPELQSEKLSQFVKKYTYLSLYKDPYYGQCHVLQNPDNYQLRVVIKETLSQNDRDTKLNNMQDILLSGDTPGHKNIIGARILADLYKVGFIWKKHEIYFEYDYILFDLEKEFEHRMSNFSLFSEAEIKFIIRECVKGFIRLDQAQYNSVRMKHIYFCDDGAEIRLAHPHLFNYHSNLQVVHDDNSILNIYLSPQEVKLLQFSDPIPPSGSAPNAFSFGMIILSLMTMKHLNDVYDYRSCQINFKKIQELINICNNYSIRLISIVRELLKPDPNQRITFEKLLKQFDGSFRTINQVELTLVDEEPQQPQFYERIVTPNHPNYIAALVKPKVDLNGQYMRLNNEQEGSRRQPQVIASQRFRYYSPKQDNVGNYLGSAVTRGTSEKKQQLRHGQGVYQHKDGQTYIGEWKDGKMNGFGKLYYNNKKLRYEGEFKDDLFHGNGTEYSNQQIYQREQQIDQDYIKIFKGNWIKYQGYYVNDKREGAGKIYFKKGFWRGNFKNGQPNGEGIYTCHSTDKVVKGLWVDGVRQEEEKKKDKKGDKK